MDRLGRGRWASVGDGLREPDIRERDIREPGTVRGAPPVSDAAPEHLTLAMSRPGHRVRHRVGEDARPCPLNPVVRVRTAPQSHQVYWWWTSPVG